MLRRNSDQPAAFSLNEASAPGGSNDAGFSLIEAVLAIALTGLLVTGTLTLLRISIYAGTLQRDHANAHAWLQSASDRLYSIDKVPCNPSAGDEGESAVRDAYDLAVDAVPNPEGWANNQIRVVPPVEFWNAADANGDQVSEFFFGPDCEYGDGLSLQRIELEVISTSGTIIEAVEIVK